MFSELHLSHGARSKVGAGEGQPKSSLLSGSGAPLVRMPCVSIPISSGAFTKRVPILVANPCTCHFVYHWGGCAAQLAQVLRQYAKKSSKSPFGTFRGLGGRRNPVYAPLDPMYALDWRFSRSLFSSSGLNGMRTPGETAPPGSSRCGQPDSSPPRQGAGALFACSQRAPPVESRMWGVVGQHVSRIVPAPKIGAFTGGAARCTPFWNIKRSGAQALGIGLAAARISPPTASAARQGFYRGPF